MNADRDVAKAKLGANVDKVINNLTNNVNKD